MDKYQNLLVKLITPCLSQPEELLFDEFTQRINDHYDTLDTSKVIQINNIKNKNKDKGDFFEYISLRLIQLQAFKQIKCHQAWLFKDIPQEWREYFKFTQKDMGIDIIVQTINNEWLAVRDMHIGDMMYDKSGNYAVVYSITKINKNCKEESLAVHSEKRTETNVEIAKFKELEDKIKHIVSEQVFLKKQISILEEALKNKELEIEQLKSKLRVLDEERNSVRARVDSLLDLLADIEVVK